MTATREQATRRSHGHIIERPRLTKLLDETTARVITLVAPAGYGKTTLARQWLANRPHAWHSVPALALMAVRSASIGAPDIEPERSTTRTSAKPPQPGSAVRGSADAT